ncbi:hypothetical protein HDU96_002969 [Phlyctochytrium bullatum]|nr:hypothetical protein HDU96_002969 [Phlyctochytrium bullatum]
MQQQNPVALVTSRNQSAFSYMDSETYQIKRMMGEQENEESLRIDSFTRWFVSGSGLAAWNYPLTVRADKTGTVAVQTGPILGRSVAIFRKT